MPKKYCCCTDKPPPPQVNLGSCCRPIHLGCVGKKYRFTVNFLKLRYPCFTFSGTFGRYRCPSGTLVPTGSTWLGQPEHWRLTINYEIKTPTMVKGVQGTFALPTLTNVAPSNCNDPKSICNFTPSSTDPCNGGGDSPYSNNQEAIDRFAGCYDSYQIRDPQNTCISNSDLTSLILNNLLNVTNYSFQFIPSSTQIATNYSPILTPNLLSFNLSCRTKLFQFLLNNLIPPYMVSIHVGFGLQTQARCSGVLTPINIPFSSSGNPVFAGGNSFNGLFISNTFTRALIPTDPMNMCFPKNTQLHPIAGGCTNPDIQPSLQCLTFKPSSAYKDEFSSCSRLDYDASTNPFTNGYPRFIYGAENNGLPPSGAPSACEVGGGNGDLFNTFVVTQLCSNYQIDSILEVLDVT